MKAGEQWSTFVVPTILTCVARGIRAGITFVGATMRDFRKGRSSAGKLTCTHSFRGGAAKKKTIQHSHANIPPATQTTKISFKG